MDAEVVRVEDEVVRVEGAVETGGGASCVRVLETLSDEAVADQSVGGETWVRRLNLAFSCSSSAPCSTSSLRPHTLVAQGLSYTSC
jgi:hypothetical protein